MQELLSEVGNELRVTTTPNIVIDESIKVLQVLDAFVKLVFIGAVFGHGTCVKVAGVDNAFGHRFHSRISFWLNIPTMYHRVPFSGAPVIHGGGKSKK